jgi:putative MATE family efflux protein
MDTQSKKKKLRNYEIDMCNGPLLSKILLFTVPLILSGLLQLMFNAADIVVMGRFVGKEAMAAVGSTGSLINLLTNVFIGLSVGGNVLVAHFYGANQSKELDEVVHTAITAAFVSGCLLVGIGFFFSEPLLLLMGTPEDVIGGSVLYIRIYFAGMPFMLVYNFGSAILRAVGDTRRPLYYLLIAGVVNVGLNLIFVFVFSMSVDGVALATVISQAISAALIINCLMKVSGGYRLNLRKLRIVPKMLLKMVQIGVPAGLQGALFSFSNVLIQSSVNSFGSVVMAGNTAGQNLEGFVYTSMNSFSQTALSFTGQNMGAGKYKRILKVVGICLLLTTIVGLLFGNAMFLFGGTLLQLYSTEAEVIGYGLLRMSFICTLYFLCGTMDIMVGAMRGMGYSIVPMLVALTGACGFRIIWIYTIFRHYHNLESLYISYPISWGLTFAAHCICFAVIYHRVVRKAEKLKARELKATS